VLLAGESGFVNFARLPGFGGFYVDPFDPWLNAFAAAMAFPRVVLDGAGQFSADWTLPVSAVWGTGVAGEEGWTFQLLDVGTHTISAPIRIQKL
jgi:hypothetical protein